MIDGGAIGLKVAIDVVKRPALSGVARVYTWLTGNEVLVVGQGRAGKTSFVDYLSYGILLPSQPTPKTIDERKTAAFRVRVGRESALELKVKSARDVSGQVGAVQHAVIAEKRKPHAILVVLDLSAPATGDPGKASGAWLIDFCKHLDERMRNNPKMRKRLKSLIFVANKYDSQKPEAASKRIDAFRRIVQKHLEPSFATKVESLPILPCICVQTDHGSKMIDAVITQLARSLAS